MDKCTFKRLERANAQIDVWIDEEEYDEIAAYVVTSSNLKDHLKEAFKDKVCTKDKDAAWSNILNEEKWPVESINIKNKIQLKKEQGNSDLLKSYWSRLFWVKLIQAKIQEKGTDCYSQRLDEVTAYLERHLPPIRPVKKNNAKQQYQCKKLVVIYLLEMATLGLAVDQRSFAERARRLLKDGFDKEFKDFYELLARYNIGVGHFHEGSYGKAVREFNFIT